MAAAGGKVRATVTYSGRVQGVGFRFTAVRIAEGHDVTGFVANLPDGTVRLVAEGSEEPVRAFLAGIRRSNLGRHIDSEQTDWGASTGAFRDFSVSYRPDD